MFLLIVSKRIFHEIRKNNIQITFQRASLADAETLLKIQIAAFNYDFILYPHIPLGGPPNYDSLEHVRQAIQVDDYYAMRVDETYVGGIVLFKMAEAHYHLDILYIHPDYHNQGIGTKALAFLEAQYPHAKKWTLHTPTWAIRNQHFYEKCGYIKVGERVEPDIVLIAYEKQV